MYDQAENGNSKKKGCARRHSQSTGRKFAPFKTQIDYGR
ncbi:hypothetical protein SL1157_2875 [Ruegeria lacuscaerulensis ITI-1157]|nr:hypothetical protein SL1157_2875 [Ruegeria lacuscaerulensis ITI-1157]